MKQKILKLIGIAGMTALLDQVTKTIVLQTIPIYHSIPVIPGFFNLTHVQNPGGAFGFLAGQPDAIRKIVFLAFSLAAVGVVLYFYHKTPRTHAWLAAGFALIFGGALGNLIDRIRFGKVIDFLDLYVGSWHWPAFNIADSAITVGIVIFFFHVVSGRLPD